MNSDVATMDPHRPIQRWFSSLTGKLLLQQEREWNRLALREIYGMHLMQLGMEKENFAGQAEGIHHPFVMGVGSQEERSWSVIEGEPLALPIATESLSAIILPHLLEFSEDPYQLLREATRVLVEDGTVVIYGFSPWGLFRLRNRALQGRYHSQRKVADWLQLLGYEVQAQHRLPLLSWSWRRSALYTGGYQLVAKRRVTPMNPIRPRWRQRASVVTGNLMNRTVERRMKRTICNDG